MDIEKEIRETWFDEHVATLTKHGDLTVLDWQKPGISFYYCRYVFDGKNLYISGDIGEAVFLLTWRGTVDSFKDIGISYFHEKMEAYSEDKYDFSSEKVIKRLREWLKDMKYDHTPYDHDEMRDLFNEARNCSSTDEWVEIVRSHSDFISDLDQDYWEWLFDCGDVIPLRVYGYLIGLKMASEQLREGNKDGQSGV